MGRYISSKNSKTFLFIVLVLVVIVYTFSFDNIMEKWNKKKREDKVDNEEGFTSSSSHSTTNPNTTDPSTTNPNTTDPNTSTTQFSLTPNTVTSPNVSPARPPATCVLGRPGDNKKSIISKHSGAAYNIEFANPPYTFFIYQKPFKTGENDHVFSVINNGLYVAPKDVISVKQKWIMVKGNGNDKYIVPYSESKRIDGVSVYNVLQYDSGYLTLRPKSDFHSQKWIYDDSGPVDYGIKSCVLSTDKIQNNRAIGQNVEDRAVHEMYRNKMGNILNLIQSNLVHFNNSVSGKMNNGKTVSSVFGKGEPIKLTVNVHGLDDKEKFIDSTSLPNDDQKALLEKLDAYEKNDDNFTIDNRTDLQRNMNVVECKKVKMEDYVNPRVGPCNCNISDLAN